MPCTASPTAGTLRCRTEPNTSTRTPTLHASVGASSETRSAGFTSVESNQLHGLGHVSSLNSPTTGNKQIQAVGQRVHSPLPQRHPPGSAARHVAGDHVAGPRGSSQGPGGGASSPRGVLPKSLTSPGPRPASLQPCSAAHGNHKPRDHRPTPVSCGPAAGTAR